MSLVTVYSIEWNSIILGSPAHEIVNKTIHKTAGVLGCRESGHTGGSKGGSKGCGDVEGAWV